MANPLFGRPGYARPAPGNGQREGYVAETMQLTIGEERPIRLPAAPGAGEWSNEVSGMSSAVEVRKLWAADPYPDDDEDEAKEQSPAEVVFMVRAVAPGSATLRFTPPGGDEEPREVHVEVAM
jgi:hypothetical protein